MPFGPAMSGPRPSLRFGVQVRNLVPIRQDVASSRFESNIKVYLQRNGLDVTFPDHTLAIESYHDNGNGDAYYTLRLHDRKNLNTVISPLDYGVSTPAGSAEDFDPLSDLVSESATPPLMTLRTYILDATQGRLNSQP